MSVEELRQAYERQLANPPRHFDRPQDIATYISEHEPSKTVKATLELTVLDVDERDRCWHINLIAKGAEDEFPERKRILDTLDEDGRAQYMFCLSLWKAKKQSRNRVTGADYVPGKSYTFTNVKDLHTYFGVAQGSLQASFAVLEESTDEPRSKQKRKAVKDQRPVGWCFIRMKGDNSETLQNKTKTMGKGRSIQSRLQQRRDKPQYDKRSRQTAALGGSDGKQSKRRRTAELPSTLATAALEAVASDQRIRQTAVTRERNRENQGQQPTTPTSRNDEELFYAEIDAPLSKICAVCGERVQPKTTRTVVYNKEDRVFKMLTVNNGRGLIEAGIHTDNGEEHVTFCARCDRSLARRQVPLFSAASGFEVAPVPLCLTRLNPMEARMLGVGVCFTTCFTLGPLGQSATRGNSINFWNEVCDVVTRLPRPADRCGVIRLKKSGPATEGTYYPVRPWYLLEALNWLKENNPIYRDIVVDHELLEGMPSDPPVPEFVMDEADVPEREEEDTTTADGDDTFTESFVLGHERNAEREEDKIAGALQGNQGDLAYVLPVHETPINEYETKLLMQSCFPTLFPDGRGGFHPMSEFEKRKHTYKLAEYCAHLMAWHDRRFVIHPTFKFFCLNLVQRRQIDGLMTQVKPSTQVDAANDNVIAPSDPAASAAESTRQYLRDLKPYFRCVRGTSLYWSNVRDDVMAMIGNPAMPNKWPTFFITLSAADTIWPDFYRVCDPSLTFDQAANLSPSTKRKLLNENPDLAAHHFHRRFRAFFDHILCGNSRPLGDIVDYFWRIEFQHRGSPHVHALLWIANAPDILELSKSPEGLERLRDFADKFVSCYKHYMTRNDAAVTVGDPLCQRPPSQSEKELRARDLEALIDRVQQHVCSSRSSCQKNGKCRFDFPKAVQDATVVTREETPGSVKISFHHRRDNDATNNYNAAMLVAWRANMDIKIIGNAYGAAEYVAAYVSKAEPDSVRFYRTIEQALNQMPSGVPRERLLKRTANTLLAIREVSAQETVYILSSTLNLYGKSRTILKVKVSRHDRRYYRVTDSNAKPKRNIREDGIRLEDIELAYMKRPDIPSFEALTFREFCESYEISKDEPKKGQHLQRWSGLGGHGYIKARRQKQVVRPSPRYRTDEQNPDYCYAQLFLHRPWRELSDVPDDDDAAIEAFRRWKDRGTSPWLAHICEEGERASAIAEAEQTRESTLSLPSPHWSITLDTSDFASPSNVDAPAALQFQSKYQYSGDDITRARNFMKDVLRPYIQKSKADRTAVSSSHQYLYPTDDLSPSLTADQWRPFAACMKQSRRRAFASSTKSHCNPMRLIICGEGGTGKSWLIRQIREDLGIVFGKQEAQKKVVLMAHQGSAAHLIGGRTIASALGFNQSCNFRSTYESLLTVSGGQTTLQRLQHEYEDVHLIIVDEFGTVSSGMLHWMDQRLREIFPAQSDVPFGGRDMIFTGDPGQLPPVKPSALSIPKDQLNNESEKQGRELWESITLYFELKQQNRGQSDPEWFSMLGRLRSGLSTPSDLAMINARVIPPPNTRRNPTFLAYRNVDVDGANMSALKSQGAPIYHIPAYHQVHLTEQHDSRSLSVDEVKTIVEEAKHMTSSATRHLGAHLDIAIGAPVTLTYNMEQRLGLCNGSRGVVYDVIHDPASPQPIVLVRMQDYTGPSFLDSVSGIVPILCRSGSLVSGVGNVYRLSRTALPLRLGYATTIHKSQGQTCHCVVLNPYKMQNAALAYVALSRVRSRQDIFLTSEMTESQLEKKAAMRQVDDTENERVCLLIQATNVANDLLIPDMVAEAMAHNHRVATMQ